jgi:hypothetical protein
LRVAHCAAAAPDACVQALLALIHLVALRHVVFGLVAAATCAPRRVEGVGGRGCACLCVCVRARVSVSACKHAYGCVRVHARVRAEARACVCARARTPK